MPTVFWYDSFIGLSSVVDNLKDRIEVGFCTLPYHFNFVDFVSDFKLPSVHVKKSRVWAVKQFFHFLVLNQWASKDIARDLAYPKIKKSPELGHGVMPPLGLRSTFSLFQHAALNDDPCQKQCREEYCGRDGADLNRLGNKGGAGKRRQDNKCPVEKEI